MIDQGKIERLRMTAYADVDFSNEVYSTTALINPDMLKESYQIIFNQEQPANASSSELRFSHILPGEMNFTLIFDSTGIFEEGLLQSVIKSANSFLPINSDPRDVYSQVADFKQYFIEYQGDTHQPNYVRFEWGEFRYDCRITKIDIEYKLFNNAGKPVRAFVHLVARDVKSMERSNAINKMSSPDLTHVRTVKAGDTLQLLTESIYGDAKYYLAVARANKLINFRNLKTGQELFFPPIAKN